MLAIIGAKPPAPGEDGPTVRRRARAADAADWGHGPHGRGEVAPLLTLDTDSPASIVSCVARARERGRTLRDVISTEMWEALNSFYLSLGRYDLQAALLTGPYSVYQEVKERCALFWGLVDRTMLRDEGRSFLEAGGRIEEADMVLRMLRVAIPVQPLERPAATRWATRPRRSRCSRPSAASRPTGARCAQTPGAALGRALPALRGRLPGLGRLLARCAARRALAPPTPSRAPRRRCSGSGA